MWKSTCKAHTEAACEVPCLFAVVYCNCHTMTVARTARGAFAGRSSGQALNSQEGMFCCGLLVKDLNLTSSDRDSEDSARTNWLFEEHHSDGTTRCVTSTQSA